MNVESWDYASIYEFYVIFKRSFFVSNVTYKSLSKNVKKISIRLLHLDLTTSNKPKVFNSRNK